MITYKEAEAYILDIPKFAGKSTPADTKKLLKKLTGGKINSKIIHIAGTNGKGSVCAYLRSVLLKGGLHVGMFTSPHLETMRERISVDKEMISEEAFVTCFEKVRETAASPGQEHPSFFEFLFLMAMVYFMEKAPEYIILETGLGGRLDATNSIEKPKVSIITEIGYDHMQYLGNTLSEIAAEKAGIIRPGVPVVFLDKRPEVTDILSKYAKKAQSPTVIIGKDSILDVNIRNKTIDFSLHTGYYNYDSLSLSTVALYQTENASLAVAAAELLAKEDERITEAVIKEGLQAAHWPGRMEEIFPGIYLDGAHNEDGIEALLGTIKKDGCSGRRFLLFGVVADKRYEKMIEMIVRSGLFAEIGVTVLDSDRSASLDKLKEIWGQYKQISCFFHKNAEEAYQHLLSKKKDTDIIYIAGSLYLIGQIKALVRRIPDD